MKGLMVTLLVLSCTGMVQAKQLNDNGFQPKSGTSGTNPVGTRTGEAPLVPIVSGENSGVARRSTDGVSERARQRTGSAFETQRSSGSGTVGGAPMRFDSTRTDPNRFDPDRIDARTNRQPLSGSTGSTPVVRRVDSSATPASGNKTVYLGLPNSAISVLRESGLVEAKINPFVDQITISDRNVPKAAPKRSIQPEVRGDTLVFRFTENELANLDEYSFEYKVPDHLKGYVTKAAIEYPPALQRTSTPQVGTGFQSDDRRWRLAGQTTREPAVGADPFNENIARRDLNQRTLEQRALEQRILDQRALDQRALDQRTLDRQRDIDRLAYAQMLKDKEARESIQLADKNRLLQNQIDQLRYEQQQALIRGQQGTYRPTNQLADNSFLIGNSLPLQTPVVQPTRSESLAVTMMQNQMQQMQNRLAQLDNENRRLGNQVQTVTADNDSLRNRFNYNNERRTDLARTDSLDRGSDTRPEFSNRPVMSTGGFGDLDRDRSGDSLKDKAGAAARTLNDTANDQGWKLLMLIMLLCSVGLNLYLWAVARGFYMRYEELANELRETFTVTA